MKTLVIDLPTLRLDWLETEMPRLAALAKGWHRAALEPAFPPLTCPAQAALTTGAGVAGHGLIANGIMDRETGVPEFWVFHDDKIGAKRIWEEAGESGFKTGVFFFLNINGAKADAVLLPKPIHNPDGSMQMWCYHKPEGFYPELVKTMGHFNLLRFWGPMAGIDSSKWIAEATRRAITQHGLDLSFVYLPHTDYAPQKFGPNSDQNRAAHRELDGVVADLIEKLTAETPELKVVIVSEYGITDVDTCLAPNVVLRRAGLLKIEEREGREHIDYAATPVFAMADHQICHVYCRRPEDVERVRELFAAEDAVEAALTGAARGELDHPRSGEVVLIAKRNAWFAYHWWEDFAMAPAYAKTIDIHNKPGYDPLEMFWDAKINGTAQDLGLIKGSHGAIPRDADQKAAVLSNLPGIESAKSTREIHERISKCLVV